jgi:hypothetical protein
MRTRSKLANRLSFKRYRRYEASSTIRTADQGSEPACFNLGVKYDNGQGVAQDTFKRTCGINLAASASMGIHPNMTQLLPG